MRQNSCLSVFCAAVFFIFSSKYRYSYRCDNFQTGLKTKNKTNIRNDARWDIYCGQLCAICWIYLEVHAVLYWRGETVEQEQIA